MMMKGDRKKMSMAGEAHLHNDRDQLAPSPARARCGPCGVLVHIALLAHFELVHIVHIYPGDCESKALKGLIEGWRLCTTFARVA